MQIEFAFGPHITPFVLKEDCQIDAKTWVPFHGIISKGMAKVLQDKNISPALWEDYAPLVEREVGAAVKDQQSYRFLRACHQDCKVLSFGQSAMCVKIYLEQHYKAIASIDLCRACNIKEGHTSSVWKIFLHHRNAEDDIFILNVSRDSEAAIDLALSSAKMKTVSAAVVDSRMCEVQDIETIVLHSDKGPYEVTVTRNEYVAHALEIHRVKNNTNNSHQYILVDEFITEPHQPAHICSLRGRRASVNEQRQIDTDIDVFLENAASCLSQAPHLNINEGDVVWNGTNAVVIAMS